MGPGHIYGHISGDLGGHINGHIFLCLPQAQPPGGLSA